MASSVKIVGASIVSKRYLHLARVTAESFCRHNPDVPFYLLLADEPQSSFDPGPEPFQTVSLAQLQLPDPLGFRFQYNELELSYACTPYLIEHLLDEGFDGVVFLKQETLVLDSLAPLFEKLRTYSLVLTPHFLELPGGSGALRSEINVLRAGVFNGGVLGFSNCEEARIVLDWWKRKLRRNCFRAPEEGLHFEQRWLDFMPCIAPRSHILRDPGVNVGHWNLPERRIRVRDGRVTANGSPCRVFRFSGYQPENPRMVTKYNLQTTIEGAADAAEVFRQYQTAIERSGWPDTQRLPYAFDSFQNGQPITDAIRRSYHDLGDAASEFGDPFETERPGSFYNWLAGRQGSPASKSATA
jgi:hypothetical protein